MRGELAEQLNLHAGRDCQYTSIAFAETLVLEEIAASIGSVGDAYDNALAETAIGPTGRPNRSSRQPQHGPGTSAVRAQWSVEDTHHPRD